MYLRGRLVGRGFAEADVTPDRLRLGLPFLRDDARFRLLVERRETANATRSRPRAAPGPTSKGTQSEGREGSEGKGAAGRVGPGPVGTGGRGPAPKSGAQERGRAGERV